MGRAEQSEAKPSPPAPDVLSGRSGSGGGCDGTGEDQRARPAVLAAFVEISDADSVFQYRVLF